MNSGKGSEHDRASRGRHAGIQPPLHAVTHPESRGINGSDGRSQLSSSSATAVNTPQGMEATIQPGHQSQVTHSAGAPPSPRPNNPMRQNSTEASRWLAFTLPVRYRKRYDDFVAQRAKEQKEDEEERRKKSNESALDSASATSDSDSNDTDDHRHHLRHPHLHRKSKKRRRTSKTRQDSSDHAGEPFPPHNKSRSNRPNESKQSSRSSRYGAPKAAPEARNGHATPERRWSRNSYMNGGEPHFTGAQMPGWNTAISAHQAGTPGWSTPWRPGGGVHNTNNSDNMELGMEGLGLTSPKDQEKQNKKTRLEIWQRWLIRSAFAPLFFRLFNLSFTACILAVAIVRQLSIPLLTR